MPRVASASDSGSELEENGVALPTKLLNEFTPIREKRSRSPAVQGARKQEEKVTAGPSSGARIGAADESDEEDDDEDGEVFVVEKVIRHEIMEDEGTVYYEIKWQNYPHSDNTWEPEDNLDGARDLLEAYFKKLGGHPMEISKAPPKKRGRKSHDPSPPVKKSKAHAPTRAGRRGIKSEDEDDRGKPWPDVKVTSDWMPPKPRKDSWEDILLEVETLSVDPDGTKWAFVLWSVEDEKGEKRKGKVLLSSASAAAPQVVIKFFVKHLVFTQSDGPLGTA